MAAPTPMEPRIPRVHAPEREAGGFATQPHPQARWLPDPDPGETVPPAKAAEPAPRAHLNGVQEAGGSNPPPVSRDVAGDAPSERLASQPERPSVSAAYLEAAARRRERALERLATEPAELVVPAAPAARHDLEPVVSRAAQALAYDAEEAVTQVSENEMLEDIWSPETTIRPAGEEYAPLQADEAAWVRPAPQPVDEEADADVSGAMSGSDSVRDIWSRLQAMGADSDPLAPAARGARQGAAVGATWENFEQRGVVPAFVGTVKGILFTPGDFFDQLPPMAGKVRPLIFADVVNIIVMIFALIWDYFGLKLGGLRDLGHTEGFQGLGTNAIGGVALLGLAPLFTLAFMFVDAALSHLLLGLLRAATRSFDETLRTVCYTGGPWIAAIVPVPYAYLIPVLLIWHMTLQAIGLRKLHEAAYPQVLASVLVKWSLYFMASFALLHMLMRG